MQARTTTGLIGANAYLQETRVPMKVFKEARAEGDTAKMERAMGYVGKLGSSAMEYKKQADKGLEEDARKAKEERLEQQEELAQRIRDKRAETEERIEETRGDNTAVQEEGAVDAATERAESAPELTYTKEGEVREQKSSEVEFNAVV